jgi:hypothetical protein
VSANPDNWLDQILGAILLDLEDPSGVIGSRKESLLQPESDEPEAYVPSAQYSFGAIVCGDQVLLPTSGRDSSTRFALVDVKRLLHRMPTGDLTSRRSVGRSRKAIDDSPWVTRAPEGVTAELLGYRLGLRRHIVHWNDRHNTIDTSGEFMSRSEIRRVTIFGSAFLLAAIAATNAAAVTAPPGSGTYEFQNTPAADIAANRHIPSSMNAARVPSSHVPTPASLAVSTEQPTLTFAGLTMKDQRNADSGNQFSLEPPDQGLCVGGANVLEAVNDVFRIYNTGTSTPTAATSLTEFFTGLPQIVRTSSPVTYGPFLSDPKCYVDPSTGRFFLSILEIDQNSQTGAFDGRSATYLAVSKKSTPTVNPADWFFYTIDTTDNGTPDQSGPGIGGTRPTGAKLPNDAGCPCLGDQPLIGADKYGFYVTTNEFSLAGPNFNGAQVYALDKSGLEKGSFKMQAIHGSPIGLAEGPAYSLQPATSPTTGDWSLANNGTAYFLSALDFNATLDNRIAEWRLTNTSSLATMLPNVNLQSPDVIDTQVYGQPPAAMQMSGPTPLGTALKQRENLLNTNDDRMNQVVLQGGHLWGAVNTVVKTQNGPTASGIAWFDVNADNASIANQGYVAVNNESVMFPSIAIAANGKGVMTFSLSGPDFYPSSAYVRIGTLGTTGTVRLIRAGVKPADGFTGYQPYGGNGVERWGDYSAAVPDSATGAIWVAAEDIPGSFGFVPADRGYLANWGTSVARVMP